MAQQSKSSEDQKLFEISGLELSNLVRNKEISPTELIEKYIQKIESVNPHLNALVEPLFAQAREDAAAKTKILAQTADPESLPIYFGVPFTVKEMLAVQGGRRTAGNIHRRNEIMDYNSTVIERLHQAGAILLGTTNVPELGFWFETENSIYGRTNNPYDYSRTSGGSSGGESALIGAGASPFGLGSDSGGSIRMPASFCGIFGHKPTWKTVPLTGYFALQRDELKNIDCSTYSYTTIGYMARKAKDLYPLMRTIAGPDAYDPCTRKDFTLLGPITDLSKLKVYLMPDPQIYLCQRTDQELQDCVKKAGRLFEQFGASVEELDPSLFNNAVAIWYSILARSKSKSFTDTLTQGGVLNYPSQLFKLFRGKAEYTFPSLVTSMLEKLAPLAKGNPNLAKDLAVQLEKIDQTLKNTLGPNGILILPPHPRAAPKHRAALRTPFDFVMTGIFNTVGYPATSIPMGLNKSGLPLGVQVVALPFCDHLNLSVAEVMESTFGGWIPPENAR